MGTVVVNHLNLALAGWPARADGLRIAHVSDLHLKSWNRALDQTQELLLGLEYDLLAVTGDFSNRPDAWPRAADLTRRLFAPLHPPCGSFAVLGNHDDPRLAEASDVNLRFLRDESVTAANGKDVVTVAGVGQTETEHGSVEAALTDASPDLPIVLLAHYPSTIYEVPHRRVGLMLAGHTHGGQIRLPLLGCLWTNDLIPTRLALGFHIVDGTALHVSPGIGRSGPIPWRFRCKPGITVLRLWTLESTLPQDGSDFRKAACEANLQKYTVPI
ncbi:MAG: metallophosphoesterase [Planctomycetota bacterium]|jgi:predicted MPP superfamily phosphohydrolase